MSVAVNIISIASLSALFEGAATAAIKARIKELSLLVQMQGWLGKFPDKQYSQHYVDLTDDEQARVQLALPVKLADNAKLEGGEFVEITGLIEANIFQGKVSIRIDVTEIREVNPPVRIERQKISRVSLEFMRSLPVSRVPFPEQNDFTLSVISSKSSAAKVYDDFRVALNQSTKSQALQINIERKDVNVLDAMSVASAIDGAKGQVIVIIRGGGDDEQFAVFEHPDVLSVMSSKFAYRVTGLGHAGNSTLLDMVADYSAVTPTAAGTHIGEMYMRMNAMAQKPILIREPQKQVLTVSTSEKERIIASSVHFERMLYKKNRQLKAMIIVLAVCLLIGFWIWQYVDGRNQELEKQIQLQKLLQSPASAQKSKHIK